MQVLRKGPLATIECPWCKSMLSYVASDVKDCNRTGTTIVCSVCNSHIRLLVEDIPREMTNLIDWDGE